MEQGEDVHRALEQRDLLPTTHLAEAGSIDAQFLLKSQSGSYVDLVGPVSQNHQWQSKHGGYNASQFQVDWLGKHAICPEGKRSVKWTPGTDQYGRPNVAVRCGLHDCRACPTRSLCTRSATAPRHLTMRLQAEYEILQQARLRHKVKASSYSMRAAQALKGFIRRRCERWSCVEPDTLAWRKRACSTCLRLSLSIWFASMLIWQAKRPRKRGSRALRP